MNEMDEILSRINDLLKEKEWGYQDLAFALNMSRGWMSQIMNKQIQLRVTTLLKIAEIFGKDLSYFSSKDGIRSMIKEEFKNYVAQKEVNKDEQ